MGLLNKLDKKFRHWGIPHITLYLIFGQVLVYFAYVSGKVELLRIYLIPASVIPQIFLSEGLFFLLLPI